MDHKPCIDRWDRSSVFKRIITECTKTGTVFKKQVQTNMSGHVKNETRFRNN